MAVQGIGQTDATASSVSSASTSSTATAAPPTASSSAATAIASLQASQNSDTEAAIVTIGQQTFSQKLDNYLSDYNKGLTTANNPVKNELLAKGQNLVETLDPKSRSAYLGYTTTFSTDERYRFINGTADALSGLKKITG